MLTQVLVEHDDDRAHLDRVRRLAAGRGAPFLAVILTCDIEENARRLTTEARAQRNSLSDPATLRALRAATDLLRVDDAWFSMQQRFRPRARRQGSLRLPAR